MRTRRTVRLVAVECDGQVEVHLPGAVGADYATLCGLDGDDDGAGQTPAEVPRGARVTCHSCIHIWRAARAVPARYIAKGVDRG